MTGLINESLDVARVTRPLIMLDTTFLDAKRIVAETLERIQSALEWRGHNLQVNQPSPALAAGDYKRLVQIRAYLLNNAAKLKP